MSEKRVSLADAIKGAVSDLDTAQRKQIEYIDIDLIDEDKRNFYTLDGLDDLAANIALFGVMDPLIVRSAQDGRVVVTSGHRRRAAVRKLIEDGNESVRLVPCIRDDSAILPELQELQLIFANSDTRKMSGADISQQVERVRELLYKLQEQGYEFPGRMRDHVAEACKISKTKIATLDVISKGLSKSNAIQSAWKKGTLSESVAYEMARLPRELQDEIVEIFKNRKGWHGGDLRYLYVDNVKKIDAGIKKLETFKCDLDGKPCQDCAKMKQRHLILSYLDSAYNSPECAEKCCEDCRNLAGCKEVCPYLKAHQDKLKSDQKAAAKREKELQAEKDAPVIARIRQLWGRFGKARAAAHVSVEDAMKTMRLAYGKSDEAEYRRGESGEAKFTVNTGLPYGWRLNREGADALIAVADKLDCTVDYLLCRTDEPKMATAAAVSESDTKPTWRTGFPGLDVDEAVIEVDFGDGNKPARTFATWCLDHWEVAYGKVTDKVLRWYPLPEE